MKLKKIVPDTSVIIDGRISEIIKNNPEVEVIIPEAAVSEIEFQANSGKEVGLEGLKELKNLHEKLKDKLKFAGEKPGREDIKFSQSGNAPDECPFDFQSKDFLVYASLSFAISHRMALRWFGNGARNCGV